MNKNMPNETNEKPNNSTLVHGCSSFSELGIVFRQESDINPHEFLELLYQIGFNEKHPQLDFIRVCEMCHNSLVVTARCNGKLIAAARFITDYACTTFISEVMVCEEFKKIGIGSKLLEEIRIMVPKTNCYFMPSEMSNEYIPSGNETMKLCGIIVCTI